MKRLDIKKPRRLTWCFNILGERFKNVKRNQYSTEKCLL